MNVIASFRFYILLFDFLNFPFTLTLSPRYEPHDTYHGEREQMERETTNNER
jgi:hypothetical protein